MQIQTVKKLISLIFTFLFLPAVVFSQGVYKTNLGLTLGANFPIAMQEFTGNYKGSYNFGFHIEHTVGKITVVGGEFNFARFAPNGDNPNAVKFGGLICYMKVQDNSARYNDVQIFLKGGAGFALIGNDNLKPQHGVYLPLTYELCAGAGVNYFVSDKNKFFAETDYRYFYASTNPRSALFLNVGFSVYLR